MTYVIIGNGPAGINAIEQIIKINPEGEIILVSKENTLPYSRIMLPEYLIGEVCEDQLYYRDKDFYARYKVNLRLGRFVTGIIPEQKIVTLDDGSSIAYDKLLIATGSSPVIPKFAQCDIGGVFTLWDKNDVEKIRSYINNIKEISEIVVIGGGLLGLQIARALSSIGLSVTVVEKQDRIMPLQLDKKAGILLMEAAGKSGVKFLIDTEVLSLEEEQGSIKYVVTNKGKIKADAVFVSVGVKPNLNFVENTGLNRNKGLIVNEYMETNIPDIYAAGDIAEAREYLTNENTVRALWPCAVRQGKVAGLNMAGCKEIYDGSIAMNSIELFGLSLISFGELQGEGINGIMNNYGDGNYQMLFFREDRLVGAIFAGSIQNAGVFFNRLGEKLSYNFINRLLNCLPY
ncbi:MAG TPA: NAD(P)/FAD-dependent oxidoreductase [Clostridiaceae bacterium]|nr:NAD(P)/FAD-dependent oxidoreductase [Clostridiaceae bacterium]